MPLHTSITREGELLPLPWSAFHITAMVLASMWETGSPEAASAPEKIYQDIPAGTFDCYPDAPFPVAPSITWFLADYGALAKTPIDSQGYTLTERHQFRSTATGEVLELLPGDVLRAWRT